jgi:hypothetical protein
MGHTPCAYMEIKLTRCLSSTHKTEVEAWFLEYSTATLKGVRWLASRYRYSFCKTLGALGIGVQWFGKSRPHICSNHGPLRPIYVCTHINIKCAVCNLQYAVKCHVHYSAILYTMTAITLKLFNSCCVGLHRLIPKVYTSPVVKSESVSLLELKRWLVYPDLRTVAFSFYSFEDLIWHYSVFVTQLAISVSVFVSMEFLYCAAAKHYLPYPPFARDVQRQSRR